MVISQMMVDALKYLQNIQKCTYTLLLAPLQLAGYIESSF